MLSEEVMSLRGRGSALVAAAAMGLVGVSGCDGSSNNEPAAVVSETPSKSMLVVPVEMDQYLRDAEKANLGGTDYIVKSAPRPTLVQRGQEVQSMIIRDEAETEWVPGRYRLVIYCFGDGVVYATIQIGSVMGSVQIACDPKGAMGTADAEITAISTGMAVVAAPIGVTAAAVTYGVKKV